MNKYVSLDKRSKKAQREYHAKQRRTWGSLNPVTRAYRAERLTIERRKNRGCYVPVARVQQRPKRSGDRQRIQKWI